MAHPHLLPWLGLLLATGLCAQGRDAVRAPHVGRVRDTEGKPVAEAAVTFVAAREFGAADTSDVARATSDANGRFRLDLLPMRSYLAWAAVARADGQHVSAAVPRGGSTTELVIDAVSSPVPDRLAITGTNAWQPHGPLRVELTVGGCSSLVPPATLGPDSSVPLPPLPEIEVEVAVFASDRLVYVTAAGLRGAFALPAPQRIAARVQDAQGKPVAGASLQRLASLWLDTKSPLPAMPHSDRYLVAVTDAEGKAELLVGHGGDPFEGVGYPALVFVATKPGYRESASGFTSVTFCNGERQQKPSDRTLSFTLAAEAEVLAKVNANAGRMPRELGLLALQSLPYDNDSTTSTYDFVRVPVGEDGTCAVPGAAKDWGLQVIAVPEQVVQLADDDPFRRAAAPHTLVLPPSALREEGGLDLRRIVPLRVQVLDATSGPAMGAAVLCTPKNGNEFVEATQAMRARTDAAGRVVLPVMPGTWFLVVVQGPMWAKATLEVGASLEVQTLRLEPLDRMPVRIVDGDRKPIAGARFHYTGASWSSGSSAEEGFLCGLGHHLAAWSLEQQVADADGRAVLPFVTNRWLKIEFTVKVGERTSEELRLRANEETTEIVVK